eukprot:GGOE01019233.1.p1 GENE.GGOE01019233.1~~GGOE01019233.1.p1  ORF type:complete len:678 (+),score=141.73 GGOE01019233.1:62-2095(+)
MNRDVLVCSGCGNAHCGGLVCVHCQQRLVGGFVPHDDPLVTVEPPSEHSCQRCGEVLLQNYVIAEGATWHRGCFGCHACGKAIADLHYATDTLERPHHSHCLRPVADCQACGMPVQDWAVAVAALLFHPRCYTCRGCAAPLIPEDRVLPDGSGGIMHAACAVQRGHLPSQGCVASLAAISATDHLPDPRLSLLLAVGVDVAKVEDWTVGDVARWLEALGLPQYAERVHARGVVGSALLGAAEEGAAALTAMAPQSEDFRFLAALVADLQHRRWQLRQALDSDAAHSAGCPAVLVRLGPNINRRRRQERTAAFYDPLDPKLPPSFVPTDSALMYYRTANRPEGPKPHVVLVVDPQRLEDPPATPRSSVGDADEVADLPSELSESFLSRPSSVSGSLHSGATGTTTGFSRTSRTSRATAVSTSSAASSRSTLAPNGYVPDLLSNTAGVPDNPRPEMGRVVPSNITQSAAIAHLVATRTFTEAPLQPLPFKARPVEAMPPPEEFTPANLYYSTARNGVAGAAVLRERERAKQAARAQQLVARELEAEAALARPTPATAAVVTAAVPAVPEAAGTTREWQSLSCPVPEPIPPPAFSRRIADMGASVTGRDKLPWEMNKMQASAHNAATRYTSTIASLRQTHPGYSVRYDYDIDYQVVTHRLNTVLESERKRVAHRQHATFY